jgi:hypothetical protein
MDCRSRAWRTHGQVFNHSSGDVTVQTDTNHLFIFELAYDVLYRIIERVQTLP